MAWHLTPAAARITLGEVGQGEFVISHSAAQDHRPIAVVGEQIIAILEQQRNRCERLVPHSGDLKPALALPQQNTLASIPLAAEVHELEQIELRHGSV